MKSYSSLFIFNQDLCIFIHFYLNAVHFPRIEHHPKPSSKQTENVSLAKLFNHLWGGYMILKALGQYLSYQTFLHYSHPMPSLRLCFDCASSHTARSHRLTMPHQEFFKAHCSNKDDVLGPNMWHWLPWTPVARGAARLKPNCSHPTPSTPVARGAASHPYPPPPPFPPQNSQNAF